MTQNNPTLVLEDPSAVELLCPVGFMRQVLEGARRDADMWAQSAGANDETKRRWAARGQRIKDLLAQLPPPTNPRDPYDDIPGEPTSEEAEARWRERAAADDAREAAKKAAQKPAPAPDTVSLEDLL